MTTRLALAALMAAGQLPGALGSWRSRHAWDDAPIFIAASRISGTGVINAEPACDRITLSFVLSARRVLAVTWGIPDYAEAAGSPAKAKRR